MRTPLFLLLILSLLPLAACNNGTGSTFSFTSHAPLAAGVQVGTYDCLANMGGVSTLYNGGFEITSGDTYRYIDGDHKLGGSGSYSVEGNVMHFTSGDYEGSEGKINPRNKEIELLLKPFVGHNEWRAAQECWPAKK
jgi:hypothetical protein